MTLEESYAQVRSSGRYVEIRERPGIRIDLKYATPDNFMGRDVYGPFRGAFLHHLAAERFESAIRLLQERHPGWGFLIFDALRPRSVTRLFWEHLAGTPEQAYVAKPERGSIHNYGCALDLTLLDSSGMMLDMGTPFDAFTPLSQPNREELYLKSGELNPSQLENRLILRRLMEDAGFEQLPYEWWHYDAFPGDQVRATFPIIE